MPARWRACAAALVLAAVAANGEAARAAAIACAPREGGAGRVTKIVSPLVIELAGGARVALAEIGAPRPSADRPGTDIASAALTREALGKTVKLYFDGDESDRHGRAMAQVFVEGAAEPWLQRLLVAQGAAYVDTWPTDRACAADLLAAEVAARASARGLWGDPANRILPADEAREGEGRFALVDGTVMHVTRLRSPARIYVDFGPDWHTDFTIRIEAKAAHLFNTAKIDPQDWEGKAVRVRGYVGWRFGPEIEVSNPEQIELIDARSVSGIEGQDNRD